MAKSIVQTTKEHCYLCGRCGGSDPLDKHHVFFGPFRKKSEHYGLTLYLCHFRCHIFGEDSVHKNAEIDKKLKSEVQRKAMKHYGWAVDEFRQLFGKNYLLEKDIHGTD